MNRILLQANNWVHSHGADIQDFLMFLLSIIFGTFIKIYKEPHDPKKWALSRFFSESMVSLLIAGTMYEVNDHFLHFPILLVMVFCVWGGSVSGSLYKNVEGLFDSIFESLKVFISNRLKIAVLFFSLSILAVGCKAKPIISTDTKEVKQANDILKEKTIDRNLAIIDSLRILIHTVKTSKPECDSITNAKIDELMAQINAKKQSGDNSFGVYYDKLKKELIAYANVGSTKTEITNEHNYKTEIIKEASVQKIPVRFIPKWVQILAYIGAGTIAFGVFKLVKRFYV